MQHSTPLTAPMCCDCPFAEHTMPPKASSSSWVPGGVSDSMAALTTGTTIPGNPPRKSTYTAPLNFLTNQPPTTDTPHLIPTTYLINSMRQEWANEKRSTIVTMED